jgi:hypothetical protein
MNVSRRAWMSSLIGVGTVGAARAAQQPESEVFSGSDIGFRGESVGRWGQRIGTLVVRVDGKWVPAEFAPGVRTAK